MKRALAERAKAQRVEQNRGVPNPATPPSHRHAIVAPQTVTSIDRTKNALLGGPPRKIQRTKSVSSPQLLPKTPLDPLVIPLKKTSGGGGNQVEEVISSLSISSVVTDPITKEVNRVPKKNRKHVGNTGSASSSNRRKSTIASNSSPPSKRVRKSPTSISSSSSNTNNITPSSLPLHPIHSDDDDNGNGGNGFYLKHQNRALTSELYSYKHSIRELENERDVRRKECLRISEALGRLEGFWREMEVVILGGLNSWKLQDLGTSETRSGVGNNKLNTEAFIATHSSTGSGKDVEMISTILDALTALVDSTILPLNPKEHCQDRNGNGAGGEEYIDKVEKDNIDENYESYLNLLSKATNSFSDRCCRFQKLLLDLVRHMWSTSTTIHLTSSSSSLPSSSQKNCEKDACSQQEQVQQKRQEEIFHAATLQKQIATLQTNCCELENRIKGLVKSRNEANISERRVRKGLYRLASGRLKIEEVLKAVEKEGSSSLIDPTDTEDKESQYSPQKNKPNSVKVQSSGTVAVKKDPTATQELAVTTVKEIKLDGKVFGLEDILAMKKKIVDLGLISEAREKQIAELLAEKENYEKKINELLAKGADLETKRIIKDEDIKVSKLYNEISLKLSTAEREVIRLKKDLLSVNDRWAVTKGNLELSRKTVNSLTEKHYRRLKELAGENDDEYQDDLYDTDQLPTNGERRHIENAKKFIELENKLKHALDNVRQADTVRMSLIETNLLNGELQNQVEELKGKNLSLLASTKAEARMKSTDSNSLSSVGTPNKQNKEIATSREFSSSTGFPQDKMRSMRKQLQAAVNSKEQAKAKQERAEKDRDIILKTNARLLKQIQEKDDMNAKSLSTILHLKQLSEQLEQQKDILEKKEKEKKQLEIATRLAANAKERVEEEAMREKELVEKELKRVEAMLESSIKEKEIVHNLMTQSKAEVSTLSKSLNTIRDRCDELVNASSTHEKEKIKIKEALVVAKKVAVDAMKKSKSISTDPLSSSGRGKGKKLKQEDFSAKDLTTLTNVLKGRLACPVCNTNDKEVILLRCRHMFCRHCVDINIKNRSRKCPACAQRFDTKDVADIWL